MLRTFGIVMLLLWSSVWSDGTQDLLSREIPPDPLLDVALKGYEEAVAKAEEGEDRVFALLELAQAQILLDDLQGARKALEELPRRLPESQRDVLKVIWGDLLFQEGNVNGAADWLATVESLPEPWQEPYLLLQARVAYQQNGLDAGLAVLGDLSTGSTARNLQAAAFYLQSDRKADAVPLLEQVVDGAAFSAEGVEARIRLARILTEQGNSEQAMALVNPVVEKGTHSSDLEIELYPVLIAAVEAEGDSRQAAELVSAFTKRVKDPALRVVLHGREAHHRIQSGALAEMDKQLGEWIARYGDEPALAVAQVSLAQAWASQGDYQKAVEAYERHNSVFTGPETLLESMAGLAEAQMELEKYAEASTMAKRTRERLEPNHPLQSAMLYIEADAALRLGEMEASARAFEEWLNRFPEHPQAARVLLRSSEAFSASGQMDKATRALDQLRRQFPDRPEAETALLQKAVLLGPKRVEQALGAFDAYLEAYPEGVYLADAMTEKGVAAYRLGLFDLAIREFQKVEQQFPEHPRVEQAVSLMGWATYLKGDDDEARLLGESFLQRYPESEFEPDVRMWLAEMAYNRGEYGIASREFQVLTGEKYPAQLRSRASYLAGRSLLASQKGEEALPPLEASLEMNPESPLAPEVLFYLGDALTELDRFDEAIVRFQQLLREYPTSYLAPAAQGRIGDCQYTLGEENAERYEEALHTYRQVMEASGTPLDLRLQATYKTGRALASLERRGEAQELFLKAVAGFRENYTELPASSRIWFVRSVTDAAQYYESQERYRDAIRVYRELATTDVEGAAEALRRIEDLRREHLILF